MTCVCGHEEAAHTGGNYGSACAAEGRSPGSSCNCAGYSVIPRCDFCMTIPAVWSYPCRTSAAVAPTLGVTFVQTDDWAACADCAPLIESDDPRAVAERLTPPDDLDDDQREQFVALVLQMQTAQFWSVRAPGGRERIAETAPS